MLGGTRRADERAEVTERRLGDLDQIARGAGGTPRLFREARARSMPVRWGGKLWDDFLKATRADHLEVILFVDKHKVLDQLTPQQAMGFRDAIQEELAPASIGVYLLSYGGKKQGEWRRQEIMDERMAWYPVMEAVRGAIFTDHDVHHHSSTDVYQSDWMPPWCVAVRADKVAVAQLFSQPSLLLDDREDNIADFWWAASTEKPLAGALVRIGRYADDPCRELPLCISRAPEDWPSMVKSFQKWAEIVRGKQWRAYEEQSKEESREDWLMWRKDFAPWATRINTEASAATGSSQARPSMGAPPQKRKAPSPQLRDCPVGQGEATERRGQASRRPPGPLAGGVEAQGTEVGTKEQTRQEAARLWRDFAAETWHEEKNLIVFIEVEEIVGAWENTACRIMANVLDELKELGVAFITLMSNRSTLGRGTRELPYPWHMVVKGTDGIIIPTEEGRPLERTEGRMIAIEREERMPAWMLAAHGRAEEVLALFPNQACLLFTTKKITMERFRGKSGPATGDGFGNAPQRSAIHITGGARGLCESPAHPEAIAGLVGAYKTYVDAINMRGWDSMMRDTCNRAWWASRATFAPQGMHQRDVVAEAAGEKQALFGSRTAHHHFQIGKEFPSCTLGDGPTGVDGTKDSHNQIGRRYSSCTLGDGPEAAPFAARLWEETQGLRGLMLEALENPLDGEGEEVYRGLDAELGRMLQTEWRQGQPIHLDPNGDHLSLIELRERQRAAATRWERQRAAGELPQLQ